jgi:hypothetical protein
MENRKFKALVEFADALGLKLRRVVEDDNGTIAYKLFDKKGEPLCTEYDSEDIVESLTVYGGSHPNFEIANEEWSIYA